MGPVAVVTAGSHDWNTWASGIANLKSTSKSFLVRIMSYLHAS